MIKSIKKAFETYKDLFFMTYDQWKWTVEKKFDKYRDKHDLHDKKSLERKKLREKEKEIPGDKVQ